MQKGKPAKKYSQAGRLHSIIRLLETRRSMTLDDLAEECGVDRRTIHRDLKAIEEAGYALTSAWEDGKKVYSFVTKSRSIPPITFTLNQLLSLYLLRSLGSYLEGTPFQHQIEELFRNITSVLPDRYAAHLERIARVSLPVLQGVRNYSAAAAYITEIEKALLQQYRIKLSYAKKGLKNKDDYEFDPYTLVFYKGGIYLLGYAHNRKGVRLFALERVRGVELTRQRFEINADYQPEAHFSSAFGLVSEKPMHVKVRFSAKVAHTVRDRLWMPDQQLTADDEGRVIIEFNAGGELELVSWILSYGMHAEVLEPPELRREIKRHIREMREFYRGKEKKEEKQGKHSKEIAE